MLPMVKKLAFSAHLTVSKRAPVAHARRPHTEKGSFAGGDAVCQCGTSICRSSWSVLVHVNAAMSPPAEVPVTTLGSRFESSSARTTPM